MTLRTVYRALTVLISLVWIVNGLVCKVLMLVPRHREIVSQILGDEHAGLVTRMIGLGELGLGIWILSRFWSRLSALLQIGLVLTMNALELFIAKDLLLWGPLNALFATMFVVVVGWHEFWLKPRVEKIPPNF